MKRLLSALLCAVLLFSITACGSSNHTSSDERDITASESVVQTGTTESETVAETGTTENESATETEEEEVKTAVVCFSGTGTTMAVAETIADVTGGDLFEIIPTDKYTDEDLNYNDDNCRANQEQKDPDARPAIENDLSAVEEYDVIYLGHPIWWGTNPRIIQTFLDTYNLTDATIYTFCTSGGSGIEKSISDLQTLYPDLQIVTGKRLNNASEDNIREWIDSISE